jgi:hypothetical protein
MSIVGMNTYLADASYYLIVSRITSNVKYDYQYNSPFYVKSLIESEN